MKKFRLYLFIFSIILVLLTGLQQTWWQKEKTERFFKQELLQKTNDIARTINPILVERLTFTNNDTSLYEFRVISDMLISYSAIIENVNLYTLQLKDNVLYFGPESSEVGSIHHIQPGTRYKRPQKEHFSIFSTGNPVCIGPYEDEYGSFITCLSPVIDPKTGKILMIVGLDIFASTWYQTTLQSIFIPLLSTLAVLFLITIWYISTTRQHRTSENNHEKKAKYNLSEAIFAAIIGGFITLVFFLSSYRQSKEDNRLLFDLHTENFSKYFRSQLNFIAQQSVIVKDFFNASTEVTPSDFHRFTKPITDERFGLAFAYLKKEQTTNDTATLNTNNLSYRITMVAPDPLKHFPIGFNFSKYDLFNHWINQKEHCDRMVSFTPKQLTIDGDRQYTLISVSPLKALYFDEKVDYLITLTGMKSLLSRLTNTIYHDIPEINIDLVDVSEHNKVIPLARFSPNSKDELPQILKNDYYKEYHLYKVIPFQFMNRSLAIIYYPDNAYGLLYQTSYWWLSGTVMAILTVILTILILFLQNREAFLSKLVAERTIELKLALGKAEQSEKLKSTLLLNFSHELRTPLNAILGFSDILTRELTQPEKKEMANHISVMGNRLLVTFNAIIKLAQLETTGKPQNLTPIKIKPITQAILSPLKKRAKLKNISFSDQIDAPMPVLIDLDSYHDILFSLSDNAIKFTETGNVWISVSLNNTDEPPTPAASSSDKFTLTIVVKDTGIGINKEQMEYIFDDFRQGSEGADRIYEGSGIGLALTKKLIEALNGTISVQSTPFEGSSFTVNLPVDLAPPDSEALEQLPSQYHPFSGTNSIFTPNIQVDESKPTLSEPINEIDSNQIIQKPITKPPTTLEKNSNDKLNLIKKTDNTTSLPSNNYILLISDNQADNIITEHYLIDFCRLDIATNANLGYKYARQNYYDIIMIDAALKEDHLAAQSINLLRTIKEYENTPIIVISNFLTPEERQTLITLKVAIVISKPFTKQDLIDYIKRLSAR